MSSMAATLTRVEQHSIIKFLLPISVVVFLGSPITFLHYYCNAESRWLLIAILFGVLCFKGNFISYIGTSLSILLFTYLSWCFLSTFWSLVPLLSLLKSLALVFVALALIRGGIEWIIKNPWEKTLNYLLPVALFYLLAGLLGNYVNPSISYDSVVKGVTHQYHGLVNGYNAFGTSMSLFFPIFLWHAYKERLNKYKCLIWTLLAFICLYFVSVSLCRAAVMIIFCILMFFVMCLSLNKKVSILLMGLTLGGGILLLSPSVLDNVSTFSKMHVFKMSNYGLLHSREFVWQASYEAAEEGGLSGLGYGTFSGQSDIDLEHGLTSSFAGREKGNSPLAMVEETGVIGLSVFTLMLLCVFTKLIRIYLTTHERDQKVLIGIISGALVGLLVQSFFEGWWVSPGAPESLYFWLLVGIIRGLEITNCNKRMINATP